MFYKVLNYYKILTFNPDNYNTLIDRIIKSKGYICYIDPSSSKGIPNPRYLKYIDIKQEAYKI